MHKEKILGNIPIKVIFVFIFKSGNSLLENQYSFVMVFETLKNIDFQWGELSLFLKWIIFFFMHIMAYSTLNPHCKRNIVHDVY